MSAPGPDRRSLKPSALPAGTVAVWRARLDPSPDRLARLARLLDPEEQQRASRFRFDRDRWRFVAGRGQLREILASYLGQEPASLAFGYGAYGKPFLVDHAKLHFNLSHAEELLLVALSAAGRVGVDVERIPADSVIESVSRLVYSAPELERLWPLPREGRRRLFGELWTRKEAYIKADGRGMSLPLGRIDVVSAPGEVLVLDPEAGTWSAAATWRVHPVPVSDGSAGAVVVEGATHRCTWNDWPVDA